MKALCKDGPGQVIKNGLRSTSGRLLPKGRKKGQRAISPGHVNKDGLKGQKAVSPGHRPGYTVSAANALQGQKHFAE